MIQLPDLLADGSTYSFWAAVIKTVLYHQDMTVESFESGQDEESTEFRQEFLYNFTASLDPSLRDKYMDGEWYNQPFAETMARIKERYAGLEKTFLEEKLYSIVGPNRRPVTTVKELETDLTHINRAVRSLEGSQITTLFGLALLQAECPMLAMAIDDDVKKDNTYCDYNKLKTILNKSWVNRYFVLYGDGVVERTQEELISIRQDEGQGKRHRAGKKGRIAKRRKTAIR